MDALISLIVFLINGYATTKHISQFLRMLYEMCISICLGIQKGTSHMFIYSAKLHMKNSSNKISYFEHLSCAKQNDMISC